MFTLTLTFKTFADLHDATGKLATVALNATIAHFDRPDVGAEPAPPPVPATTATFNPFAAAGGAVVPVFPPVHSTAAVAASPIALAAPMVGLPPPPPVAPPPAPPSAPVAVAPTTPVAPPSPAVGAQLDKDGLPWDARIHAKTKTMNADGTWRRFRGVQDALVAEVEAQLRASMSATVPVAPMQAALPLPAPPVAPFIPAPPPGSSPVLTLPAAPAALPLGTFADLMAGLAPHMQTGKVSNLTITTVLGDFQLANLYQLATAKPGVVAAIGEKFRPYILAAAAA